MIRPIMSRRTSRGLAAFVCLAAGTLGPQPAGAATPHRIPFTAHASETSLTLSCDQAARQCRRAVRGVGTATHLGRATSLREVVGDRFTMGRPCRRLAYTTTLTLGAGDTLTLRSVGWGCDDPADPDLVDQSFTWSVTGGAGRLRGARGGGVAYDWVRGQPAWGGRVTYIGTLALPGA